jgi:two-component system sensor histidine kinase ChvG
MDAKANRWLPCLVHSFSLKLILLALILLSTPLILYWQFSQAEREQLGLLSNAVGQTNHVLAAMLRSHFEEFASEPSGKMQDALSRAVVGDTRVKILVRLADTERNNFIYVASVPNLPQNYLDRERAELIGSGIFNRLAPTCDGTTNLDYRFVNPSGKQEILAAMTPVHVGGNCWIVITSESAASLVRSPVGLPFWKTPTMRVAGMIYLASIALVIWLMVHMWRNVHRFRKAARHIRLRNKVAVSFGEMNTITELRGVAEDFDSLVGALVGSQRRIKAAAEENSHALKAPLAVMAQAIEPIKRAVPPTDAAAMRGIQMIERSVVRLDAMVSANRDLEDAAADLVYPVRQPMNLSRFLKDVLPAYETMLAGQGKRLVSSVKPDMLAHANEDVMEPVVENLLENAASFTPEGGAIEIRLDAEGDKVCLRVLDRGPGVRPRHLPLIFDRAVSFRSPPAGRRLASNEHQGLGLWIAKRNIESLGGTVNGRNRTHGGFEIIVRLSLKR